MKTIRRRTLTGAFALAVAAQALCLPAQPYGHSHDPMHSGAPAGTPVRGHYANPLRGKFYFGFDAGVALQQDIIISDSVGDTDKVSFDPGVRLDMMLGCQFTPNWATEIEMGVIANQVKRSYVLGTDYANITYVQLPILVNGIYSFPLNKPKSCSAYVGAGVGGIFSQYSDDYGGQTPGDSAFAYQVMAGFGWTIRERWEIGLAYKFLGTTSHNVGSGMAYDWTTPTEYRSDGTMTHSILVTLTFQF